MTDNEREGMHEGAQEGTQGLRGEMYAETSIVEPPEMGNNGNSNTPEPHEIRDPLLWRRCIGRDWVKGGASTRCGSDMYGWATTHLTLQDIDIFFLLPTIPSKKDVQYSMQVGEKQPTKGVASIVVSPYVSNPDPTHYLHDGSKSYSISMVTTS